MILHLIWFGIVLMSLHFAMLKAPIVNCLGGILVLFNLCSLFGHRLHGASSLLIV